MQPMPSRSSQEATETQEMYRDDPCCAIALSANNHCPELRDQSEAARCPLANLSCSDLCLCEGTAPKLYLGKILLILQTVDLY